MGKLKIEGRATKEYEYDLMEVTIRFQVCEETSAKAIEKVIYQCEDCLETLAKDGIAIENIRIGKDDVDQDYNYSDEFEATATREIIVRLPLDITFSNYIMELVKDKEYDVDINIEYKFSKLNEINNELLKSAIDDSKSKASLIADAMNQKIIGIDSVEMKDYYKNNIEWMEQECCRMGTVPSNLQQSNKLKSPVDEKSSSVEVVWIIE